MLANFWSSDEQLPYQTISLLLSLKRVPLVPADELLNADLLVHPNEIYQNATVYASQTFLHAFHQSNDEVLPPVLRVILFRMDKRSGNKTKK